MSTLIQFRRGNAAAIPSLNIGEPGWSLDTKTFNIGDGTSTPPLLMSTKSTGSFNFSTITDLQVPKLIIGSGLVSAPSFNFSVTDTGTGFYSPNTGQIAITSSGSNALLISGSGVTVTGNIVMGTGGTVDSVTVASLNPIGVQGIMAKIADDTYAMRNLVPGNGIAPMVNNAGAANAGGASGDIVIAIANNPTIPGNAGIQIPYGSSGARSGITANNGVLRYNTDNNYFEGYINGAWSPLVNYIPAGVVAQVPSQFTTIQAAINYYETRATNSTVTIQLGTGTFTVNTQLNPGSLTNRVFIQGQTPTIVGLGPTPVGTVTGSAGNWLVQYKLNAAVPVGITTGMSLIVYQMFGSGDIPVYDWANADGVSVSGGNLQQVVALNSGTNLSAMYNVNDYILFAPGSQASQLRKVTSIINSTTLGIDAPYGEPSADKVYHRRLLALAGTISASNSATLTGTGTSFLTSLNVGDYIFSYTTGQIMLVKAIASNTSLTVSQVVTITAEPCCQITNVHLHKGCWVISAIDSINNIVTVVNTSQSPTPPPVYGIISGTVAFIPSNILFTNQNLMTINDGQFMGFCNLTARYTGVSPAQGNYFVYSNGGDCQFTGLVGSSNAGLVIANEASTTYQRLFVSGGLNASIAAVSLSYGSNLTGSQLVISGNLGDGMDVNQAEFYCGYSLACSANGGYGTVMRNAEGWFGVGGASSHNGLAGVFLTASNGAANAGAFNSNGWAGQSSSILMQRGCSFSAYDCGYIFGNANYHGVSPNQDSYFYTNAYIIAANAGHGVGTYSFASFDSVGVTITNNLLDGAEIRYISNITLGSNSIVKHNNQHGVYISEGSFGYATSSVVYKGATGFFDVQAYNSSSFFLQGSTGSGGSGAFVTSPNINGVPGNRNSSVYTQASA